VAVRVVEVMLPNKTVALVQAADLDEGGQGAEKVGWRDVFDFVGVSGTLEGIAQAVRSGLEKVTPSKTTVELGIALAVKNGKLTGLVVEGNASASLKVTLEWGGGQGGADGPAA
jgi:Trypsin-co-occurring domain 1